MLENGLYTQLIGTSSITQLLGPPTNVFPNGVTALPLDAIFFGSAPKDPPLRFLVINTEGIPAGQTLSGPSALIDGEVQFDAYAESQLAAKQIVVAVRNLFAGWEGTLSDGTTIQFTEITMFRPLPYELGGAGYLYHWVLRIRAMYTEPGDFGIPGFGSDEFGSDGFGE